jgi:hypothetical protein
VFKDDVIVGNVCLGLLDETCEREDVLRVFIFGE